jgi:IS1 family transposase
MAKKKAAELPPLSETLVDPDTRDPQATTLERDELWSCVLHKSNQVWIWMALCRKTRHVVARAMGDRSEKTCRALWHAIPAIYRSGRCSPDFWHASQVVIPEKQHRAVGKEKGETAHVECWHTTLRQRLGRCVRTTLSFAQPTLMHTACLDLFVPRSHLERAISFL